MSSYRALSFVGTVLFNSVFLHSFTVLSVLVIAAVTGIVTIVFVFNFVVAVLLLVIVLRLSLIVAVVQRTTLSIRYSHF